MWLVNAAVLGLLVVDALVFRTMALAGNPFGKIYWVALVLCCIAITWTAYLSAYGGRFRGRVRDVLRFGSVLLALHSAKAVCVFLPMVCGAMLAITAPGVMVIIPTAVCWLDSITLEKVFLLHMQPEDVEKTRRNPS